MEWQKEVKKNDSFTDKNHACSGGSIADGKTGFQAEAALYPGLAACGHAGVTPWPEADGQRDP